jgi:hypothetical protein
LPSNPFDGAPALSVVDDGVVVAEFAVGGDEDGDVVDDSPVVGEPEPESAGSAYAMPGVVATPTPSATANAPT